MNLDRVERILKRAEARGIPQVLLSDPHAIAYVTGDLLHPGERFTGLLLSRASAPKLVLNRLFESPSLSEEDLIWYDDTERGALKLTPLLNASLPLAVDKKLAAEFLLDLQEAGAASGYVSAAFCADAARGVKDEEEIEKLRRASAMNDEAMHRLFAEIRGGVTEIQLARRLDEIYAELGAEGLSFPSIISFGANAADPHHRPDGTALKEGDCVLIDIGCVKDGYCSDMTRTFYYRFLSEENLNVYEAVLQANKAAEAVMKPGVPFCDIDRAARRVIEDAGYGPNFTHRLGHFIGTQAHEWGDVSSVNSTPACPGNVFSCEPGIYLPGRTGARIEDLCVITDDGVEILNRFPKELQLIL